MSLIPSKNPNSLSYWCSWHTRNTVAKIDCMEKYPPRKPNEGSRVGTAPVWPVPC